MQARGSGSRRGAELTESTVRCSPPHVPQPRRLRGRPQRLSRARLRRLMNLCACQCLEPCGRRSASGHIGPAPRSQSGGRMGAWYRCRRRDQGDRLDASYPLRSVDDAPRFMPQRHCASNSARKLTRIDQREPLSDTIGRPCLQRRPYAAKLLPASTFDARVAPVAVRWYEVNVGQLAAGRHLHAGPLQAAVARTALTATISRRRSALIRRAHALLFSACDSQVD